MEKSKKLRQTAKKPIKRKSNKFKLSVRKTITIDDLLTQCEVGRLLDDIMKNRSQIESLIVIAYLPEGNIQTCYANFTAAEVIYALEDFKMRLLTDDFKDRGE